MVNIILKFIDNPKKQGQLVAFHKKRIFFIVGGLKTDVKPEEWWECFIWAKKDKFTLVKPFQKVEEDKVNDEIERVTKFNSELTSLEPFVEKDSRFGKIMFDEDNKPYVKVNLRLKEAVEEFDSYIVKKINDDVVVRPILSPEDRKEWQQLSMMR